MSEEKQRKKMASASLPRDELTIQPKTENTFHFTTDFTNEKNNDLNQRNVSEKSIPAAGSKQSEKKKKSDDCEPDIQIITKNRAKRAKKSRGGSQQQTSFDKVSVADLKLFAAKKHSESAEFREYDNQIKKMQANNPYVPIAVPNWKDHCDSVDVSDIAKMLHKVHAKK